MNQHEITAAFGRAIEAGRLTVTPNAINYLGDFEAEGGDTFRHKESGLLLPVATADESFEDQLPCFAAAVIARRQIGQPGEPTPNMGQAGATPSYPQQISESRARLTTTPPGPVQRPDRHNDPFFPVVERSLAIVGQDGGPDRKIPRAAHRAICRMNPDAMNGGVEPVLLGIVGADYKVVSNADLFGGFERALADVVGADKMDSAKVRDHQSRRGAYCRREYVFPDLVEPLPQGKVGWNLRGTSMQFRATVTNTYDGSGAATMSLGGLDPVCDNGMIVERVANVFKRKHTGGFQLPEFERLVANGVTRFREQAEVMRQWASQEITFAQAKAAVEALPGISERRASRLLEQFNTETETRGRTPWALYSAMTFFASHDSERFKIRNTGNDSAAETLANRELEVMAWTASQPFRELVRVAA